MRRFSHRQRSRRRLAPYPILPGALAVKPSVRSASTSARRARRSASFGGSVSGSVAESSATDRTEALWKRRRQHTNDLRLRAGQRCGTDPVLAVSSSRSIRSRLRRQCVSLLEFAHCRPPRTPMAWWWFVLARGGPVTLTDERLGCLLVAARNSFGKRSACDFEYLKVGDSLCRVAVPRYQVVFRCRRSVTSRTESPVLGVRGTNVPNAAWKEECLTGRWESSR